MTRFPFVFLHSLKSLGLATIAVALTPVAAIAHGAHIQAQTTNAVEIQAAYDSGEPMAEATVQVFAPDDPQTPVFTGMTDESGMYVFVPTQPGDWEVSVRQAGHGDITVIPVQEGSVIASSFANDGGLNWGQRVVVAGAITWGCVGTALFFGRRGKQ